MIRSIALSAFLSLLLSISSVDAAKKYSYSVFATRKANPNCIPFADGAKLSIDEQLGLFHISAHANHKAPSTGKLRRKLTNCEQF